MFHRLGTNLPKLQLFHFQKIIFQNCTKNGHQKHPNGWSEILFGEFHRLGTNFQWQNFKNLPKLILKNALKIVLEDQVR